MKVLILGANSSVAQALAALFAQLDGADLWLASRNLEQLERTAGDLQIRHSVSVETGYFDLTVTESHAEFFRSAGTLPDVVVLAGGYLGDQIEAESDFLEARRIIDTNLTGSISILEIAASDFEQRKKGTIIAISSVAGERGRRTNYIYGASKAGLTTYLEGLRHRLTPAGVHVLTVLPGFIRSKMTERLDLPSLLTSTPEKVALQIYRAYRKKRRLVYTPWYWKWLMLVIRSLPYWLFQRIKN